MNKQGLGLWIVVVALLVLDIGVHCVRAQDDSAKIVKTQHLQLVDSSGNVVADFDTDKNSEPELVMYDEKGNGRMGIFAGKDGGQISEFDADGKHVCDLMGSNLPGLNVYHKGNLSSSLGIDDTGLSMLYFFDDNQKPRAALGYDPDGQHSSILLSDADGKQMMLSTTSADGAVWITTDQNGKVRLGQGVTSDGKAELGLFDKDENSIWQQGDVGVVTGGSSGTTTSPGREMHRPTH